MWAAAAALAAAECLLCLDLLNQRFKYHKNWSICLCGNVCLLVRSLVGWFNCLFVQLAGRLFVCGFRYMMRINSLLFFTVLRLMCV